MAGATAGGQLIVLLSLPILTRLYTPEEFGAFATFAGISGLFVVIAALRYELAIPLPKADRRAVYLVALSVSVIVAVALASGMLWLPLRNVVKLVDEAPGALVAALMAISVFAAGLYQALGYWLVRKSKFGVIALTRIQQGIVGNGVQIVFGLFGGGVLGLIVGQILGQDAGIVRLSREFLADYRESAAKLRLRR